MSKHNCLHLIAMIGVLLIFVGCSPGDDDDDTSGDDDAGDDDAGDDDAGDDDAGDDDTGDDDTSGACETATPCTGDYSLYSENDLESIALCETISGYLGLYEQDWATEIYLPCLSSVHQLSVGVNESLTSIDMPSLTTVGDVMQIDDNDALIRIDMPLLTTVVTNAGGHAFMSISDNDAMTGIDINMSALTTVGGFLMIDDNFSLSNLDGFSNLSTVDGDLIIMNNDCLNQAEAEAFAAAISVGGGVNVSGNGQSGHCP